MADRHQFRADWHDYNYGLYLVTICCHNHQSYFGEITDGVMYPSDLGRELDSAIRALKSSHMYAEVINFVIMPNHVHLLISIKGADMKKTAVGALRVPEHNKPCSSQHHNSLLARSVNHLKGHLTKYANRRFLKFKWQSRYYDNIIRTQAMYQLVNDYIDNNVATWQADKFFKETYR